MVFGPLSRIVGVDDGPFGPRRGCRVPLVAVLMRGGQRVDGVMTSHVVRDGFGATRAVARMLGEGRLAGQAQAVLFDGVAVGGFNVLDLPALSRALGVPVLAVMRRRPDLDAVRRAVGHMTHARRRLRMIERAGPIHASEGCYFQVAGATPGVARRILSIASPHGRYPEALRLAHLIAGAIVQGASRGGA